MKYNFFSKYFLSNFNISFGQPRSDTYLRMAVFFNVSHVWCDTLKNSIETEQNVEEKASHSMEKSYI